MNATKTASNGAINHETIFHFNPDYSVSYSFSNNRKVSKKSSHLRIHLSFMAQIDFYENDYHSISPSVNYEA